MTLEDHHVTPTPEGVSLDMVLAGLGSRLAAFLLDLVIQAVLFAVVIAFVFAVFRGGGQTSTLVAGGILAAVGLVVFTGYFVLCEMLWSGRSVGKRAAGTRVVRVSGAPVGFWSSLLRNVMRLIDSIPGSLYLVGSVLILATPKNQRLGDILANTVVIRDRQAAVALQRGTPFDNPAQWMGLGAGAGWGPGYPGAVALPPELAHWDVSAVDDGELMLVRTFLANRSGYTPEARQRLAFQLADRLWPRVVGPTTPPHPEQFLEAVLMVKSARG